jgi:DNA-directed RNA polymerase specialized sigma54-like protein
MQIELDEKDIQLLINILSKVDPSGIFVGVLLDKLIKQAQSKKEEPKIVEKKPEGPAVFGGKK